MTRRGQAIEDGEWRRGMKKESGETLVTMQNCQHVMVVVILGKIWRGFVPQISDNIL